MAKRELKKGDTVRLVTARLERIDATVDRVHADGCVDLTAKIGDVEHVLTRCPHDPEAKQPDSWHPVTSAAEEEGKDAKPPVV